MIHVQRKGSPTSASAIRMLKDLSNKVHNFYKQPSEAREQSRFKFPIVPREILLELARIFNNKCAYCESVLIHNYNIDFFRPRAGAVNLDGEFDPEHYWWLAYEWSNMYLVCSACNGSKRNLFPVDGQRAPIGSIGDALLEENALLLDPCSDRTDPHFMFDDDGLMLGVTRRGHVTVNVLDLNRVELRRERQLVAKNLQNQLKKMVAIEGYSERFARDLHHWILEACSEDKPYLLMRKHLLNRWIKEQPKILNLLETYGLRSELLNLRETSYTSRELKYASRKYREMLKQGDYDLENSENLQSYYSKYIRISRITIENFRSISKLDIKIPGERTGGAPWLMLLGENGTGKSSVLQAIALTLMGERNRRKHSLGDNYLKHGAKQGFVRIYLTGHSNPVVMEFDGTTTTFKGSSGLSPKTILLGYGSTRLLWRDVQESDFTPQPLRVDNLFNPFAALVDANSWLCSQNRRMFNNAARSLKSLLLLGENDMFLKSRDHNQITVRSHGSEVKLNELSDGYQSVVSLTTDILALMSQFWEDSQIAEGIVLIDEIDTHLHPRWKMQIVTRLREVFPRVQFIVTTHDPLCLRGIRAGEVAVMRRNRLGNVHAIHDDLPSPEGLRVDQILTSEYFGLDSTTSPEIEALFEEYYRMLAIPQPSSWDTHKIEQLKSELKGYHLLGSNRREQLMLECIDQYVSQERSKVDKDRLKSLRQETKERVIRLWRSLEDKKD